MQIFISHSGKDRELAEKMARRLTQAGFKVWNPYEELGPGDNWPKMIGRALETCEAMVVLLTPKAIQDESLRHNIQFALTSKKYQGRLLSVFVGPKLEAPGDIPWILLKLPHVQIESLKERNLQKVLEEIQAMATAVPS